MKLNFPIKIEMTSFNFQMNYIPISERTFNFAVRIVKLCSFLDEKPGVSRTISYQLLKAGTSIGRAYEKGARLGAPKAIQYERSIIWNDPDIGINWNLDL